MVRAFFLIINFRHRAHHIKGGKGDSVQDLLMAP